MGENDPVTDRENGPVSTSATTGWRGTHRNRTYRRDGRSARVQIGHQPRAHPGRSGHRPITHRRAAAQPGHRSDGRSTVPPRRHGGSGRRTAWTVTPGPLRGPATIDCGLAGTVMRFLPPLAVTATGDVTVDGDEYARLRPMTTILDALRQLGARIDGDTMPFVLHGTGSLPGGTVRIDASASSQFVSGLLLSGAGYARRPDGGAHRQAGAVHAAHRDDRRHAPRSVGVAVDDSGANTWRVEPGPVAPFDRDGRTGPVERDAVPGRRRRRRRHRPRPVMAGPNHPARRRDPVDPEL